MIYIAIGLFGVIGALLRYYIGIEFTEIWYYAFPLGTLIINLIGSFILGGFTQVVHHKKTIPEWLRLGVGTGLIGSFTTFSTFSVETVHLVNENHYMLALLYFVLSMFGGIFFAFYGYQLINLLYRK